MKRVFLVSLLFVFFYISTPFANYAFAESRNESSNTIRAGYFYNGDFMHKEADGSYAGFDIEYYYTIAGYADSDILFTDYDNLNEAMAALENGEIDVMSGLSITNERKNKFLISNIKMCASSIAIQTREKDDRYSIGDTKTMENITCGILKGSNVISLYSNWCIANNLVPHIIEYDTIGLRNEALGKGDVDAVAAGSTIEGAQKIAEFPILDLYFMFNKTKPEIKAQFDRAMSIISLENPTYTTTLHLQYFPSSRNSSPSFSMGEKKYIASHNTIRVALLEDDAPFSKKDASGELIGILPEYFIHLSKIIGTQFTFIPIKSKGEACTALNQGNVDMIGKFGSNIFDATRRNVIYSVPFLTMNLVQITRAATNTVSTIAVPQCNLEVINNELPHAKDSVSFTPYVNSEQSFAALKEKTVDAVVCTQPSATWLLNRNRSSNYVVSSFANINWSVSVAFAKNTDGNTLRTILNKTIAVDGNYINQLITTDTLQDSADLSTVFDKVPVSFIAVSIIILAVLLILSIIAIIIIITRRKAEQRLAAQKTELAAAVKANEARNAFFGAISHDMRTPLNAIVGFANIAQKENNIELIKEYLSKIQTSGNLLNSLLDNTLTLSKANSGKLELHLEPVSTKDIIESVIIPIREATAKKHISFTVDTSKAPYRTALIDKLSLQKILLNLLTNAVKYTNEGGHIELTVYHDPENSKSPDTVFIIKDSGIGISDDFLPHLYEPFSQEKRHGYESMGTGLGLSIVKQLVDKMNGTITVETKQSEGAKFTVRLHFTEVEQGSVATKEISPDRSYFKGKKMLLCEDNTMNSEIACALLREKGISLAIVENGKLGVHLFEESALGEFSAILMDVRMPIMDGYEATKQIRSLNRPDAKTIPIIAMTADAFDDDVRKCLDAGMNSHVSKPIDAEKLFNEIARFCK